MTNSRNEFVLWSLVPDTGPQNEELKKKNIEIDFYIPKEECEHTVRGGRGTIKNSLTDSTLPLQLRATSAISGIMQSSEIDYYATCFWNSNDAIPFENRLFSQKITNGIRETICVPSQSRDQGSQINVIGV